jgi:hypothetical protein
MAAWLPIWKKKRWRLGTASSVDNDPAQMSAARCQPNTANCPRLNFPNLLTIFERSLSMTIMRGEYISEYFR